MHTNQDQMNRYPVSKPVSRLIKTGVLGPDEVTAVIGIECAVISILAHDIRSELRDRPKTGPAGQGVMRHYHDRRSYYAWIEAMQAAGLSSGPVLDVILEGRPLHKVDKAWRRRKGWTRGLLGKSLRLYRDVCRNRETRRLTA